MLNDLVMIMKGDSPVTFVRQFLLAVLTAISLMFVQLNMASEADPDQRAAEVLAQMTLDEKVSMLQGLLTWLVPEEQRPPGLALSAGYAPGVPRLGIPFLAESDASLGVANMAGLIRHNDEATAMPSGLAMASTWNAELLEDIGEVLGSEARAKGLGIMLAGGVNLTRDVRGGRNFEYLGEDPLLAGRLVGHSIKGIQSHGVISTIKHFALNAQETGRLFLDVKMSEADMRESDLLAFQIGIEIGQPGSVMCAYNKVNGAYTCENDFLLNQVLRDDWGFPGWVMSDWGSVHSLSIPQGLDQESGVVLSRKNSFYDRGKILEALENGDVTADQIDRSVLRILRSMFAIGAIDNPVKPGGKIDVEANLAVAQNAAEQGIVLLKNEGNLLPLVTNGKRVLVVGAHVDKGVPTGGGSSQVWPVGGAALSLPIEGEPIYHKQLYMPSAPLTAIQTRFPSAEVGFDDGTNPERAAAAAAQADVVIVFAEQLMAENHDAKNLDLPGAQNTLIDAIADANDNTVVVLQIGNPVVMPWLDKVKSVMAVWYSGNLGGAAIARAIAGDVNPSGRLPITFPASLEQLPNPELPGRKLVEQSGFGIYDTELPDLKLEVIYPEGSDVGYRWFESRQHETLFPFGFGLSYTRFTADQLVITGDSATFRVRNVGSRPGRYVAQLYLTSRNNTTMRRLVAFDSIQLDAGEEKRVSLQLEPRVSAEWADGRWQIEGGQYQYALGDNARDLGPAVTVTRPAQTWKD